MRLFGVCGTGGFGREVMPVARAMLKQDPENADVELVFVDDASKAESVNGHRILSFDQFSESPAEERYISLAIGDSSIRERLWRECGKRGVKNFSIVASNAMFLDNNQIGSGGIFCAYSMVTSNARIGVCFHANIYAYVAHDCVVGDFVTFAPSVQCNGNVVVEDHVYVGTNATIKQGSPGNPLVIGRGAIVGMGAVVTKNVPPGVTVVGNPARVLQRS